MFELTLLSSQQYPNQQILHKCQTFPCPFINLLADNSSDPGVHFHAGLSDCKVVIGEAAELECKLSNEDCKGIWYKDGEEVSTAIKQRISQWMQYTNVLYPNMFCVD